MDNLARPRLFLDASMLVAAALSDNSNSPAYLLFKMAEAALIDIWINEQVLRETELVLGGKLGNDDAAAVFLYLARNIEKANAATASDPADETVKTCLPITNYLPDAKILAAAIERDCEVLVTYDKQHLLRNPRIGPPNTRLVVMSTGEAVDWARDQVITRARLR
jgi:predicted nucleic acid-binding protein